MDLQSSKMGGNLPPTRCNAPFFPSIQEQGQRSRNKKYPTGPIKRLKTLSIWPLLSAIKIERGVP